MAKSRTSFSKGNPGSRAFRPGQSGNPGGRAKVVDSIHALAREHAPEAIAGLVEFMRQRDDLQLAMGAMIALLDRGYGRPPIAVYAQVNGQIAVGGIDAPPRETLEQWLSRRRRELAALDGPRQEHAQPVSPSAPQPPNGEPPVKDNASPRSPAERVAERTAAQPRAFGSNAANSAADSAGPSTRSMTEQERDLLNIRRRELGLLPDDVHPNPAWKR